MAENLEKVVRNSREKEPKNPTRNVHTHPPLPEKKWTSPPIYLPDEILVQILDYVSHSNQSQVTLASCCRLSRQWWTVAVPYLYRHPIFYGNKFHPFVQAVRPSINLHVLPSRVAEYVKVLDMSGLVHEAPKSVTARLLSRTKDNLEEFVAPQASFGWNCFAPLSSCRHLRKLDLSFVSESPPLLEILKRTAALTQLATLRLPRSAGFSTKTDPSQVVWPPNLENLCLSGGIDNHFLQGVVGLPNSLKSLTVEHCPMLHGSDIIHFLNIAIRPLPNLETLKLAYLPRLMESSLDCVLWVLPGLLKLSVSVDYITPTFFDLTDNLQYRIYYADDNDITQTPTRHIQGPGKLCQLRTLELTNSGNPGVEDKISPIDLVIAVDEGQMPNLRQLRVAKSLMWHAGSTADDLEALSDTLKESWESPGKKDILITEGAELGDVGVWTFDQK